MYEDDVERANEKHNIDRGELQRHLHESVDSSIARMLAVEKTGNEM